MLDNRFLRSVLLLFAVFDEWWSCEGRITQMFSIDDLSLYTVTFQDNFSCTSSSSIFQFEQATKLAVESAIWKAACEMIIGDRDLISWSRKPLPYLVIWRELAVQVSVYSCACCWLDLTWRIKHKWVWASVEHGFVWLFQTSIQHPFGK